jgi:hypothetical protein
MGTRGFPFVGHILLLPQLEFNPRGNFQMSCDILPSSFLNIFLRSNTTTSICSANPYNPLRFHTMASHAPSQPTLDSQIHIAQTSVAQLTPAQLPRAQFALAHPAPVRPAPGNPLRSDSWAVMLRIVYPQYAHLSPPPPPRSGQEINHKFIQE